MGCIRTAEYGGHNAEFRPVGTAFNRPGYRLLLITDPDGEQFWPGQSRQLAELVPDRADLMRFTAEEGTAYHCQPTGRLLTETVCSTGWLLSHPFEGNDGG